MLGSKARVLFGGALLAATGLLFLAGQERKEEGPVEAEAAVADCSEARADSYSAYAACLRGVSFERVVGTRSMTVLPYEIDERPAPALSADAHRAAAHALAERLAGKTTSPGSRKSVSLAMSPKPSRKTARATGGFLPDKCNIYRRHLNTLLSWEQVDFLERTCMRTGIALEPHWGE